MGSDFLRRRSKVLQNTNQHLIKMEGVNTKKDAEFYFGKRVVYIYKVSCRLRPRVRVLTVA